MSEPAPDELAGGSARDPLRTPGWLRLVGLVVLVGVSGWLLVAQHPATHDAGAHARHGQVGPAPITLTPGPAQRAVVLGSQPGLLGVRAVCLRSGRDRSVS